MFILYTVAPLLYCLASSAYFNLSLLSSDFYGLLFGIHFISNSFHELPDRDLQGYSSSYVALLHLMQLSYTSPCSTSNHTDSTSLRSPGYIGTYRLFLAFHAYVCLLFLLAPSDDVCSGGTRHGRHPSPLVRHTTWMTDMLTNEHDISIFGFRSTSYQGAISRLHFHPATSLAIAQARLLNNLPCLPHKPMATTPLHDKLSK